MLVEKTPLRKSAVKVPWPWTPLGDMPGVTKKPNTSIPNTAAPVRGTAVAGVARPYAKMSKLVSCVEPDRLLRCQKPSPTYCGAVFEVKGVFARVR